MALHLKSTGIDFTDFSNESAMQSELLDAYEEGRWTAVASSGGSIASGQNLLQYVKVGNHVSLIGQFQQGNSQSTGALALQGLPFTCVSAVSNHNPLAIGAVRLYSQDSADPSNTLGTIANVEAGANTMQFYYNLDNSAIGNVPRDDAAYAAFTLTMCSA